jgi:hypothetical protein
VHAAASAFLSKKHPNLLPHLPKSLGFSLGIDYRDNTFNLSNKADPSLMFKPGMVFNLAVGFQDVEIPAAERSKAKGSVKVKLKCILHMHVYVCVSYQYFLSLLLQFFTYKYHQQFFFHFFSLSLSLNLTK